MLYVSTSDGAVSAIETESGKSRWSLIGSGMDVVAMGYEQVNNYVITGTARHVVQLLDATTGQLIATSDSAGSGLRDLVIFPDGKRFATVRSDGTIGLWSIENLGLVASIPSSQSLESIAISTDGYRLAVSGGTGSIHIMDGMEKSARKANQGR